MTTCYSDVTITNDNEISSGIDPAVVDWLEAHANDPVVKRTWLLANGLGTLQDKRDHIQDLISMTRGITTPPKDYSACT